MPINIVCDACGMVTQSAVPLHDMPNRFANAIIPEGWTVDGTVVCPMCTSVLNRAWDDALAQIQAASGTM